MNLPWHQHDSPPATGGGSTGTGDRPAVETWTGRAQALCFGCHQQSPTIDSDFWMESNTLTDLRTCLRSDLTLRRGGVKLCKPVVGTARGVDEEFESQVMSLQTRCRMPVLPSWFLKTWRIKWTARADPLSQSCTAPCSGNSGLSTRTKRGSCQATCRQ